MESERKKGVDGMEGGEREVKAGKVKFMELGLRIVAFALTLVAAVVVGADKQTEVVPLTVSSGLPPLNVTVYAKWHYLSAFVYFVVVNGIACAYAVLSLVTSIASGSGKRSTTTQAILFVDLLMVALLFSSNGAAAAISVIGYKGNSHVRWNKVCNVFSKYCHQVGAGLILSLLGSLAFVLLVLLAALNLHKKSK